MERIYINRDCCIVYSVLAIDSIYHSANKEKTLNDFIEEVKTMLELHEDEIKVMNLMENVVSKEKNIRLKLLEGITKKH